MVSGRTAPRWALLPATATSLLGRDSRGSAQFLSGSWAEATVSSPSRGQPVTWRLASSILSARECVNIRGGDTDTVCPFPLREVQLAEGRGGEVPRSHGEWEGQPRSEPRSPAQSLPLPQPAACVPVSAPLYQLVWTGRGASYVTWCHPRHCAEGGWLGDTCSSPSGPGPRGTSGLQSHLGAPCTWPPAPGSQ